MRVNASSPRHRSRLPQAGAVVKCARHENQRDPLHETGSAGTLAGELPVEFLAGKGAGAPGNGSWLQGFNARNVLSEKSHPWPDLIAPARPQRTRASTR